jgi:Animal haem peroxidase
MDRSGCPVGRGGGAAMIGGGHCLAPARTIDAPIDGASDRYSRLFPELSPSIDDNEALLALAITGGVCDGGEDCGDAAETAAGWPMFGQYVAHDITADRSPIAATADPGLIVNSRVPRANLESLYGDGQIGSPYLFRVDDPDLLLLGVNDRGEERDLPRNQQGIALIGDPRNDVHLFVSQLQVAMIGVHNRLVEQARRDGVGAADVFATARRQTAWHHQWVILHDFLPRVVDPALAAEVRTEGPRFYRAGADPKIPFEFADAAFRYGHGQVRNEFVVNAGSGERRFFPDLLGFRPVPAELVVDWRLLFDVPGEPPAQRAKKIDGTLAHALIELPTAVTGEVETDAYRSLAGRDLQRGNAYGLPSGEDVARAMGEEPLGIEENPVAAAGDLTGTPLWLYLMLESAARADGERLGPVGGRIVAEVLTGLIDADPTSYRAVDPDWSPTLPARGARFGLTDLLIPATG